MGGRQVTAQRRYGIVLGRFQPVHLGHLEYLQAAKRLSGRLVIGVTNPDLHDLGTTAEDPGRSAGRNNPFTYHQRVTMLEATCLDAGWAYHEVRIVPAPVNQLDRLSQYLPPPAEATCYVTIYDEWGESKRRGLAALGYPVETLWRRTMAQRLTTGTEIRAALRAGSAEWKRYVSPGVVPLLETYGQDI